MESEPLLIDDAWRVVTVDLDREADISVLSSAERARAGRFLRELDRKRFAAGRAALRAILSRCVGLPPEALAFTYGENGKPALDNNRMRLAHPVHFNVAHTGSVAMIALAHRPLGIDVERLDAHIDPIEMANVSFAADEIAALRGLPPALQVAAFYKAWTSREALAKAFGTGLSMPREDCAVCVDPRLPPRIMRGAKGWRLERLDAPDGHSAALAVSDDVQA